MHKWFRQALSAAVVAVTLATNASPAQTSTQAKPIVTSARATAPFDPTGYWTSVVTQNWRLRMVPPAKGDYLGLPISAAGKQAADSWDLARDEAAGNQCKAFGAPALMNLPTHLHITWQGDNALKLQSDYGDQTRLFYFGNTLPAGRAASVQGDSLATWTSRRGAGGAPNAKYLRINTGNLLPGYLRRNGVPYGERASVLEYVDVFQEADGGTLMVWTTVVTDPVNLEVPYILTSQFKKLKDGSKWDVTPCTLRW